MLNRKRSSAELNGIYLHGDVGRGKSMLMDIFIATLPDNNKLRRVHFHSFMMDVHEHLHKHKDTGIKGLTKQLAKDVKIFCFDEFHVNDVADAMILQRLFSELLNQGVILITTSNYPPDRLYEGGLQRKRFLPFIDLIKDKLEIVEVNGPTDHRARELSRTNTYFYPLTADSREKCARLFHEFTKGQQTTLHRIPLKGREIHIQAADKVALCSFSELCELPVGAEDYLALAKSFHTVFITDIPRLGYDRRNEAKRFMTLIDVLYEARTRLVLTAEEKADDLYQGHDHAFEFPRTVSRIHEMTSESYLQKWAEQSRS
jgi:cell division protein ZapE